MALTPVADALSRILAGAVPQEQESVGLDAADARVLAADLAASRPQPPLDMSAMDGYAVQQASLSALPATLRVIGESAAGHPFGGIAGAGQAVRIFTGAALPDGADTIIIQENCIRDGDTITVTEPQPAARFIRRAGLDFAKGDILLARGHCLNPRSLALCAGMGHGAVDVWRRPRVAVLATGDELVRPGEPATPAQIIASNSYGIAAMVARAGGAVIDLGIASDDLDVIGGKIAEARHLNVDVLITLGGASVGDYDHTADALSQAGMTLDFWKIAMRPGKPLMFGALDHMRVLGLPGNPVSALACARVFALPLIAALSGRDPARYIATEPAMLGADVGANDQRQDYLRARLTRDGAALIATPFGKQDSSMLATLARADCLLVRPPHAPAAAAETPCEILRLDV